MINVVYILECLNKQYYIGSTNNIERRIQEHQSGKVKSTMYKLPIQLLYTKEYNSLQEARSIEQKLKKKKSRKVIELFIQQKPILRV